MPTINDLALYEEAKKEQLFAIASRFEGYVVLENLQEEQAFHLWCVLSNGGYGDVRDAIPCLAIVPMSKMLH